MKITLFAAAALLAAGTAPASAYTSAYTTAPVYMRTGPDTAYPPVVVLPAGTPILVHGCLGGWSWCDVSWGPNRGWVAGMYLAANYQNRPYPWTYAAPRYNVPIITFFFGNYWDTHYRGRRWYPHRDRWSRYDHHRRHWRR